MNVSENVKRFRELGIDKRKFLEQQQTVDTHARAPQVDSGLFLCPFIYYQLQIVF